MIIGIDGSRAFIGNRTGIEEYSYQVIKHLRDKLEGYQVVLFVRKNQIVDFDLPANWKIKTINWPRFWTQIGLSLEMFVHPVDVLFVPAHTVPWIHPKKTIVTVHGLEYEIVPQAYSFWARMYMRRSIRNSCAWAETVVSVSENTKRDLIGLYKIPEAKIEVIYNGYAIEKSEINSNHTIQSGSWRTKYLFFIGRLEERKNIIGIIKAFEILKEKYNIQYNLILAGHGGYGISDIEAAIENSKYKQDIVQLGYLKPEEKFKLLSHAWVFMFPTLYEGFGIPILEAQNAGTPVVTSNTSSMPEVAGDSALLVNPCNHAEIAEAVHKLISDKVLRNAIIKKGYENVKRFSWDKCAQEISKILNGYK